MTGRGHRLVIATTVPGTLQSFVWPQVPALREAGWDVCLVSAPGGVGAAPPAVAEYHIDMKRNVSPAGDAAAWVQWFRFLNQARPDVVLGSTPKAGLLSMTSAKAAGVPHRIFLHRGARWETLEGQQRFVVRNLERVTLAAATRTLAVSDSLADLVVAEGLTRVRPQVLAHGGGKGVNLELFAPAASRSDHAPVLGFVGRITRDKGADTALQVLDDVRSAFPEASLSVSGAVDDSDPIAPALRDRLMHDPAVVMHGQLSDVSRWLHTIDVLVFPSSREGLPNSVIEAAACGVPTVGWDVTGVRDAIRDGVTGSVVPQGNTNEFSNKVQMWLARPRAETVAACRDWATRFDERAVTKALVDFLGSL